jgi:hypothetical protein
MSVRRFLHFAYGLMMGTSVPYIKAPRRFFIPQRQDEIAPGIWVQSGGSVNCVALVDGKGLMLNLGADVLAPSWREFMYGTTGLSAGVQVVVQGLSEDICGGLPLLRSHLSSWTIAAPADELASSEIPERELVEGAVELSAESVFSVGRFRCRLIPAGLCVTPCDLVVFEETERVLFLGPLLTVGYHPILRHTRCVRPRAWAQRLEKLVADLQPRLIVPGEGPATCTVEDVDIFVRYLRALSDPAVEFASCRQNFDWPEIPETTSLEENFDILRIAAQEEAISQTAMSLSGSRS